MSYPINRCGLCRHCCRCFRTIADSYSIFIRYLCIVTESHTILSCYGCTAPYNHGTISRSCGIITYRICIIRCDGILITESSCRITFNRTGSNLFNLIAISFCSFRNSRGTNRIAITDSIGIASIHFIFYTESSRFSTGCSAIGHIKTDRIRITNGNGFITIRTYLATYGKRVFTPASCHDADTSTGNTFCQ